MSAILGSWLLFGAVFGADALAQQPRKSRFRDRPAAVADLKGHTVVQENGHAVVYKKKNVVDFDDMLLEGEVKNPSEFYFVHRPEEKFGSLVKKRKNFHKEMLRDTVMIR